MIKQNGSSDNAQLFKKIINVSAIVCGLIFIYLWFYLLINHTTFEEWDGVLQYYSGLEIINGNGYTGWASHFWPPLFSFLLALGDPFWIGKIVSFLSGVLILFGAYHFSRKNGIPINNSILISLILGSNSIFLLNSSKVENHALEAAMTVLGLYFCLLFIKKIRKESSEKIYLLIISAICVSLAGLTRYTAYSLALAIGLVLVWSFKTRKQGIRYAFFFSIIFVAISLIWWIPNFLQNGSPLATWQYVNIGKEIHPAGSSEFIWQYQKNYWGVYDLIVAYPKKFLLNFVDNVILSFKIFNQALTPNKYLSISLLISGFIFVIWKSGILDILKRNVLALIYIGVYVVLCSIAFVFPDAFFPVSCLFILLFANEIAKHVTPFAFRIMAILWIVINLTGSYFAINDYLVQEKTDRGQLASRVEVTEILSKDSSINEKTIMSVHPARAFYLKSNWIAFPGVGFSNTCELIKFKFDEQIKEYAPKIPPSSSNISVDYIVIDSSISESQNIINSDMKFIRDDCSDNLEVLFDNYDVVIYRVIK